MSTSIGHKTPASNPSPGLWFRARRVGGWGAILAFGLLVAGPAPAATPQEINAAIQKGTDFLKQRYKDGLPPDDKEHGIGPAALAGMALLETGTPANDPVVKLITAAVRDASYTETRTYQLTLCLLFLDKLGEPADVPLIQLLGIRLLAGQNDQGGWGYKCIEAVPARDERELRGGLKTNPLGVGRAPVPGGKPAQPPPTSAPGKPGITGRLHPEIERYGQALLDSRNRGDFWDDNSNTQFAILGVWVARKHGAPVENALDKIEQRFLATQDPQTGGWPYSGLVGGPGSPSMICAGLLGLATGLGRREERRLAAVPPRKPEPPPKVVAKPNPGAGPADPFFNPPPKPVDKPPAAKPPVEPRRPLDQRDAVIQRAWTGLAAVLAAEDRKRGVPGAKPFDRSIDHGFADLYFFWSVARTAVIFGVDKVGGIDWYPLIADAIVVMQNPDGSWGKGRYGPSVDTAFALLVLTRSNVVHDLTTWVRSAPVSVEMRGGPGVSRPDLANLPVRNLPAAPAPATTPATTPKPIPAPVEDGSAQLAENLAKLAGKDWSKALERVRDAKGTEYTRALVLVIHKLEGDRKKDARDALAERLTRMSAETLRGLTRGDDPELRRGAVLACAMKDDKGYVPDLIDRLNDEDELVVRAARAGLKSLTGQDLGPHPRATKEERAEAIAAWRAWWGAQKKSNDP